MGRAEGEDRVMQKLLSCEVIPAAQGGITDKEGA